MGKGRKYVHTLHTKVIHKGIIPSLWWLAATKRAKNGYNGRTMILRQVFQRKDPNFV